MNNKLKFITENVGCSQITSMIEVRNLHTFPLIDLDSICVLKEFVCHFAIKGMLIFVSLPLVVIYFSLGPVFLNEELDGLFFVLN